MEACPPPPPHTHQRAAHIPHCTRPTQCSGTANNAPSPATHAHHTVHEMSAQIPVGSAGVCKHCGTCQHQVCYGGRAGATITPSAGVSAGGGYLTVCSSHTESIDQQPSVPLAPKRRPSATYNYPVVHHRRRAAFIGGRGAGVEALRPAPPRSKNSSPTFWLAENHISLGGPSQGPPRLPRRCAL